MPSRPGEGCARAPGEHVADVRACFPQDSGRVDAGESTHNTAIGADGAEAKSEMLRMKRQSMIGDHCIGLDEGSLCLISGIHVIGDGGDCFAQGFSVTQATFPDQRCHQVLDAILELLNRVRLDQLETPGVKPELNVWLQYCDGQLCQLGFYDERGWTWEMFDLGELQWTPVDKASHSHLLDEPCIYGVARHLEDATVRELCLAFIKRVRDHFTVSQLDQINAGNKRYIEEGHSPDSVCATHEFCDSNELMHEAFKDACGREHIVSSKDDAALWNNAWFMAKVNDFDPAKIGGAS